MATLSDKLRDKWETITPREKRLVVILGVALPTILVIFLGMQISQGLTAIEERNTKTRRALLAVEDLIARGTPATTKPDPAKALPTEPIDLQSYLSKAAAGVGVTIPGFNRQPEVTKDGFVVSSLRIDIRDLSLPQVTELLAAIETESPAVAITSLTILRNLRDKEKLDLKLDVAAYSIEQPAGAADGSAAAGSG